MVRDERNALHAELENLSSSYNECRRVLGNERRETERDNNWTTKLVVAKLLFNELSDMQERLLTSSFKDI